MLEAIFIFWIWTPKLYIVTHTFGQKKDPNDNDDGQTPLHPLAKMRKKNEDSLLKKPQKQIERIYCTSNLKTCIQIGMLLIYIRYCLKKSIN